MILDGDCLYLMDFIPTGSVDMVLCDLPYGTTRNKWDTIIPLDQLWTSYRRICHPKANIVLFGQGVFSARLILSNEKDYRHSTVWIKNKTTGYLNANRQPLRSFEEIHVFSHKRGTYNPQKSCGHKPINLAYNSSGDNYGNHGHYRSNAGTTERYPRNVIFFDVVNNDSPEKFHPTQKPVDLFEYLIKTYSNEGDTILDNCAGSGTTAIAAINTGRKYICMESDPTYFDAMSRRISTHQSKAA
jgi:DNA modification methylase